MFALLVVLGIAALLPAVGLVYQELGKRRDRVRFPQPGMYVRVGSSRIHVHVQGQGPTVVLEAGIASSSLAWSGIQSELAAETCVVSYDRAGLGWSDRAASPRTLDAVVEELHSVLEQSRLSKPYLLVGHSFGGLIVRRFATLHSEDVVGLLLLDPVETRDWVPLSTSQRTRIERGVALSRRGALLARLGIVRLALWLLASGSRRIPQMISRWSAGTGASVAERLTGEVRKLPREVWPMIAMHWSDEKCFVTMAEYLQRLPANAEAAAAAGWPAQIPTMVITVLTTVPDLPPGVIHRVGANSGHWIQLDEPELVLSAIRELLAGRHSNRAGSQYGS